MRRTQCINTFCYSFMIFRIVMIPYLLSRFDQHSIHVQVTLDDHSETERVQFEAHRIDPSEEQKRFR